MRNYVVKIGDQYLDENGNLTDSQTQARRVQVPSDVPTMPRLVKLRPRQDDNRQPPSSDPQSAF